MENLDPAGVQQVVKLLNDTCVPDTAVQRAVMQQLEQLNKHPDFNKYLTFIFVTTENNDTLRRTAGLALRNNINRSYHSMSPDVQQYIKAGLLSILPCAQPSVRRTVAHNIATIVSGNEEAPLRGLQGWPELFGVLVEFLRSSDPNAVFGAFEALELICDDMSYLLDRDIHGQRPTNTILPALLSMLAESKDALVQTHCISCTNQFLLCMPSLLESNLHQYLTLLAGLASSPSPSVRRHVCHAFVVMVEQNPEHEFFKHGISDIIAYMIRATTDSDPKVALEACEFWTAVCERQDVTATQTVLRPHLPTVVPLLLSQMVYSQEELELQDQHDDGDEEDDENELRTHHQENEEGDSDPVGWNIRKCAAAGLDNLAVTFGPEIWPHLQPLLERNLNSPNWTERECSVLALGAVADGCLEGIKPHLDQLLQYLCSLLKDPQPLIRSISCWTISRFSGWLVEQDNPERYIRPILTQLFERFADSNKRVQQVACSAFATLEDEAQTVLIPELDLIVSSLSYALQHFKRKNMLILFDALGTLADAVGSALGQPKYTNALIPPLLGKWAKMQLTDKHLLPLLECLTDLCQAIGQTYEPHAAETFGRAVQVVHATIALSHQAAAHQADPPELDPIVWSLDLISGLCVALGGKVEGLVAGSQPPLMGLVMECLQGQGLEQTRQSALALVGDLAKACVGQLRPHVSVLLPELAKHLNPYNVSVCNNSSWAIGEAAVRLQPEELGGVVDGVMAQLIEILLNPNRNFNPTLLRNCAITIGRLAVVVPSLVAQRIGTFLPHWCHQLRSIHDATEKTHAYHGMVLCVRANPSQALSFFTHVCECIAVCDLPNKDLHDQFHALLHGFKGSLGEQWAPVFGQVDAGAREVLASRYHL